MAFSDWSITNASNTTVGGINIAENCPPGNLNNGLRQIMAELRTAIKPALDPVLASASLPAALTALGALPTAGGSVTGDIRRDSAGVYTYWANPAMGSGRQHLTNSAASDPTSAPGEMWLKY